MNLLYCADSIIPSRSANSIHVMRMCEAFAKNGCNVTLVVPDYQKGVEKGIEDVYGFYGVEQTFKIIKFPLGSFPGSRYVYALRLARWLRSTKADLVYSRDFYGAVFATLLGMPVVMEFHRPPIYKRGIIGLFVNRFYNSKNLVAIVVISDALRKIFINNGFSDKRLVVAHDGSEDFVVDKFTTENRTMRIGYVGHLYEGRGIDLIVELADTLPEFSFEIIGGNESTIAMWRKRTTELRNLKFLGFYPPAEVRDFRNHCDVLLAPYQKDVKVWNGPLNTADYMSPLKIFEYMASGRAIVASDLPVLREVLNASNSILCNPVDVQAWKQALVVLAHNPVLREELGRKAREDFDQHYSWSKRAKFVLNTLTLLYHFRKTSITKG